MKIANIETYCLFTEISRSIGFSQWYYKAKNNLLIKITTDCGLVGWGECYGPSHAVAAAIDKHFKPLLLGKDPRANEFLWNYMWKAFCDFNRKGIFMSAISGLDIAFWDLKGKAFGQPLRRLLGGTDEPVACYATGMYFRDDCCEDELIEELLKEASGYLDEGFGFLKIKIGKNPSFDLKIIDAFRRRFPDVLLAADSNHAYNFKEALQIGRQLEKCGYLWFEEPLSPEDYTGMALLRQRLDIAIAGGECEQTRFGFQNLVSKGSLDIFQPDIAYCGGITEFLKIAALASASHIDVVPHCWGLKINQAAAASAIVTLGENPGRYERRKVYLEFDRTEHPVRESIFSIGHKVEGGYLYFNDLPGLGVEIDETRLQEFAATPDESNRLFSQTGE